MECISDLARVAVEAGELGDLAVGGDAAAGNSADDLVNFQVVIRH